jgi:hypothetical protein
MKWRKAILAFFAVIALALCASMLIRTKTTRAAQPCWGKLVNIESAKDQWAMETKATSGAPVTVENILPYLSKMPTCHIAGATYFLSKIGEEPSCTVHGTVSHFNPDRY